MSTTLHYFESYRILNSIKKNNDESEYFFQVDEYEYRVRITRYNESNFFALGFSVKTDNDYFYDVSTIVNKNPYKVMQTIIKIGEDFIKKLYDDIKPYIDQYKLNITLKDIFSGFVFSFTGDKIKNMQRLQLYKKYINNEWDLQLKDNIYFLVKKYD